jgi:hypothetical protein
VLDLKRATMPPGRRGAEALRANTAGIRSATASGPLVFLSAVSALSQINDLFYGYVDLLTNKERLHVSVNQTLVRLNKLLGCPPRNLPILRSIR